MKTVEMSCPLTREACDRIAEEITAFCVRVGVSRKDTLRYRLSAEECLLHWLSGGCEGEAVTLTMGQRLRLPFIRLEASGAALNPYQSEPELYGAYCESILSNLNLRPTYSYTGNRNRVQYTLERKKLGQFARLLLVFALGTIVGLFGNLLPESFRQSLLEGLINPVCDTFFRILSSIAGPMIFLSVAWGIYGIGDAATLGRIGKRMMLTFVGVVFVTTAASTAFFPLLGPALGEMSGQTSQLAAILEIILGIFPSTVIEPFATGNTLQIIFVAFMVGIALLFLGQKTGSVAKAIEQINTLVQFLMDVISRIVPFLVFLIIVSFIWSRNYLILSSMWRFFLALVAACVLAAVFYLCYTAARMKTSPVILLKKSLPNYLVATATASSAATFSSNMTACEKGFGIDSSLASFGIPLGMVMHKPVLGVYYALMSFFLARSYGVTCSLAWIGLAVFISAILAIATPPIPGGGAIAYALLLSQLGIPADALPFLLTIDIATDFLVTGFEMLILPLTLIRISHKLGVINTDILRSDGS